MPLEDWIQHSWIQHWRLVLYHWQTLAAGILALLAAWRTIRATKSTTAHKARQSLTKSAFDELRRACVEHGGNLTAKFLDLDGEIDKFKKWEAPQNDVRKGLHAGFQEQLDSIETKAKHLRGEAFAEMERATIVIAETEVPPL
jgi:hypothetical protein